MPSDLIHSGLTSSALKIFIKQVNKEGQIHEKAGSPFCVQETVSVVKPHLAAHKDIKLG